MSDDSLHAVLSPSGAKKWMTCPGAPAMERGEPNEGSKYSDEGTAAHALAAMCAEEGKHPAAYIGRVLHVLNGVYVDTCGPTSSTDVLRTFTVDTDMAGHVNTYLQNVAEYAANAVEVFTEVRVPIEHITGEKGAGGTSDKVIIVKTADGYELQVHDLKYGMGVKVFAKDNPQGLIYLDGAREEYEPAYGEFTKFRFVIHQPRLGHLDEHDYTPAELAAFIEKAKRAAQHSTNVLNNEKPGAYVHHLVAGQHCKDQFCRARAKCPKLAWFVSEAVGADFDVIADMGEDFPAVERFVPSDLKDLGVKLASTDIIEDWCKQIRARCERELLASNNAVEVQEALRYKLVQGKKGNRQWIDEQSIIDLLKKKRLKTEQIFDLSVKSPAEITKMLKDKPKWEREINELITQAPGKASVAPLDDKRDALVMKPPAEDFTEVIPDEDLA